jgi:phosphoglycerate dehydrogenase-like enzyme
VSGHRGPSLHNPTPSPLKPLVVQTEHLDPAAAAWLAERARVAECPSDDPRFASLLAGADALLIRTYTRVDDALLARAPGLRVVARAGVGLDNVDIPACTRRGVRVVSTPGANTRAVVELVFAFLLDALRPRVFLDRALDPESWKNLRRELQAPRQLCDLTLGIVGLGKVGSGVARAAAAMDMRVIYHDLLDIPAANRAGAQPVALDDLLARSDVVSLHVDARPGNRHLIGAAQLARCRPDCIIVNTSRGFVVDAAALAAFLRAHPSASAILDVHEPEPFGPDYPLLGLPNAHLAPHIGAATATANRNMSWVVRDLWRVLCGEEPEWPAN